MTPMTERWDELATQYALATGVPCHARVLSGPGNETSCTLCDSAGNLFGIRTSCSELHLFSAYQSERWGGRYIYECRMAGTYWASPLMTGGMMTAALVAGPVLLVQPDDFFLDDVAYRFDLPGSRRGELRSLYVDIPVVSPSRAGSLSEMLRAVAMRGSDRSDLSAFDDEESILLQARFGEVIHHLTSMEGDKNSDLDYPLDLEKQLLACVSRGDKTRAQEILRQLMTKVLSSAGVDISVIRSRILELVVLISRAALEGGADVEQIFGLNYRYLNAIRECRTPDDLATWVRRIFHRFSTLVFDLQGVQHTDAVLRALRFMKENFYERLTLSDVAAQAGLSADYFGRIFHGELKIPFSEYLTRLRVEEGKRLLRTSQASLGDIAYACGFEDPSYFTRVFRKTVGVTPSRYRGGLDG